VSTLCPSYEDPALCEAVVGVHWAVIGLAVYPTFFEGNMVCGELGSCPAKKNLAKEWTCEECTDGIAAIADIVQSVVPEIVEFLKVSIKLSLEYCTLFFQILVFWLARVN
jgi:hypothetical protein